MNGIATFNKFSLSTSGMKQFSVSATLNAVPVTAYSNTFSIKSFGTRSKLAFGTQPASGGSTDLVAWATQPKVRVEDSAGNLVSSDNGTPITLACVNPSSGCTLLGTLTAYTVNGIATFTNLRTAETALTNVVLEASSSVTTDPVTTTQSNSFSGNLGTSYALEFLTQPVGGADPWATQPRVRILDNQGHFVSTATDNVTLTCVSASSTCTLNGTVTVAAVSGVATFAGLSTNEAALTNVVIEASSGALVRAQSNSFTGKP